MYQCITLNTYINGRIILLFRLLLLFWNRNINLSEMKKGPSVTWKMKKTDSQSNSHELFDFLRCLFLISTFLFAIQYVILYLSLSDRLKLFRWNFNHINNKWDAQLKNALGYLRTSRCWILKSSFFTMEIPYYSMELLTKKWNYVHLVTKKL